jgi:predicted metal-binding membrane protein
MAVLDQARLTRTTATATLGAAVLLVGSAAAAGWWTVHQADAMSSMALGLAQVGRAMPFAMSAAGFFGMWAAMMSAMMLPSVAPLAVAQARGRAFLTGTGASASFLASYLGVWVLIGVPALFALKGLNDIGPASTSIDRAGGAVLVLAGVYQFTRAQHTAVLAYRRALDAPARTPGRPGPSAAARAGLREGLCCLGVCWALMAVLFVVGLMNLAWMAAIAVVLAAEKNTRDRAGVTTMVGIVLVGLGLAVLVHPSFLTGLAPRTNVRMP